MPLVKIQVPKNIHPRQVEFGKDVERSKPGALYFVPGTIKNITSEEYGWIEKHDKRFFNLLILLPSGDKSSSVRKKKSKPIKSKVKKNNSYSTSVVVSSSESNKADSN